MLVAGIDEVGRGCIAGPVTAAAVILDPKQKIPGIADSKKLSAKKRDFLSKEIKSKSVSWSIGWASVTEIDEINILQATFLAMRRAVSTLDITPSLILVDGNQTTDFGDINSRAIINGDNLVESIAAASILAKTARDNLMSAWHFLYPEYDFIKNKGYPTKNHRLQVLKKGRTHLHRRSFKVT